MESTLSLKISDLQGEVGLFLGWGRGAALGDPTWTTQQLASVVSITASGLRQFYFPSPIPPATTAYDWSFLKPVSVLNLASAAKLVPLPDDFGGFEGSITIAQTGSSSFWPVELTSIGRVYAQESQNPTTTGRPSLCCEEPVRGTGPTAGQRFQLHFWPTSDGSYDLRFQYYLLADYLTGAAPYAYGGAAHIETILESCLAIAEERLDDAMGTHHQKFMERMAASISWDRKNKPQNLGYNADHSDGRAVWRDQRRTGLNGISYRGVTY